ncbi:MAG: efflux RND transporter periplasmic adaptor subunit [Bdellovibrionales bacterium]|nr:efflux RND transporter periplasmic adaptor subunit [Bdellovibrionales bacterium]
MAVVVGLVVLYWSKFAPRAVNAQRIERGTIVSEVMGTGTLEARVQVSISAKIFGRIDTLLVDQGDRVVQGGTLVLLDEEELKQQVAIAQANIDASVAAIARLEADKIRAVAVLDQAQKGAARTEALIKSKAVSGEDADKAIEALAVATAGVSRAEAAIIEGQKELVAAERTLEYHEARLRDTRIVAPFAGLVIARKKESGDVVAPGGAILTVVSTDELWIRAWVDETQLENLRPEQSARVVFRSLPDRSYPGTVVRLGREADRETREVVVDVRVMELPRNWAVGQRAEVFIEVAKKNDVIQVPTRFVEIRDGKPGVFTEESEVAKWRFVALGLQGRDRVEVLQGLDVGDVVIAPEHPRPRLTDRTPVRAR